MYSSRLQEQEDVGGADPTKFVAKKSKAAAKKGVGNMQVLFAQSVACTT